MKKLLFASILVAALQSCTSVKEYEKVAINDPDMKLAARASERYETTVKVYREASAGEKKKKTGGGCGCN